MYNASSRSQPQALPFPDTQAEAIPARSVKPRRGFSLRSLLDALALLGEIRAMPFGEIGAAAPRDERGYRDL
jgi:hypothetical protein